MKFGFRTPSFKKSFSARTTGRFKRSIKRAFIPGYGQKGAGWIKNPKKAFYNKVYHKTTVSLFSLPKGRRHSGGRRARAAVAKGRAADSGSGAKGAWLLWFLGWLFIFPVPITILLKRKTEWDKRVRAALIAGAWVLYVLIVIFCRTKSS